MLYRRSKSREKAKEGGDERSDELFSELSKPEFFKFLKIGVFSIAENSQ